MFFWTRKETSVIENAVQEAVKNVLSAHASSASQEILALGTVRKLNDEIKVLKDKLADLETKRRQEEREIEHKLGLHKMRVDAEAKLAEERYKAMEERLEKDATVSVREAKVAAREEAMKRADELLGAQVKRMENLVDMLVKALPTASLVANIGKGK